LLACGALLPQSQGEGQSLLSLLEDVFLELLDSMVLQLHLGLILLPQSLQFFNLQLRDFLLQDQGFGALGLQLRLKKGLLLVALGSICSGVQLMQSGSEASSIGCW
jgi:hypothetical protein